MRKYLKDNLYQSAMMLIEAATELKRAREENNRNELFEILITSQELVVAMAESYEREEGRIQTNIFGEYSLILLDSANKVNEGRAIEEELILRKSNALKEYIEDISVDSFKIAFMPYKLSMWTAMESIWRAAVADKHCKVDVIPIPYFNIADGDNITMTYEGENYPSQTEIKDYRDYNLALEQPDVIVIHNPYDDCNNLTSVHPDYYSRELKKYTRCLVYSPYLTFGGYAGDKSKHFYVVPGTVNADKIIVQSKKVAQIFKSYGFSDDKLMITGSPKTDEINNFTKDKVDMPKEWANKLKGKKVFLLNTHLSYFPKSFEAAKTTGSNYAVMHHNEILNTFKNREDIALIWRPHPLLKNMIYDRYTQCAEYLEYFEKELLESNNCVIDTYGEYKYSFTYSDAMISTWSSLINEYMATTKPVLVFQWPVKKEVEEASPINRNLNYFRCGSENNISYEEFVEMVKKGHDYRREERMQMLKEAFVNMDGSAGQAAYDEIKKMFL